MASALPVEEDRSLMLRSDVVSTVLDEGAILLDLDSKYFYTVNESAWAILRMLENGTSRSGLRSACLNWGMPPDDTTSLDQFVEDIAALVEPGGSTEGGAVEPLSGKWSAPTIEKQKEPLQRLVASAFDPSIPLAE